MPQWIIIEGEIGNGKSELAIKLGKYFRDSGKTVVVILEPVEEWEEVGIFQKFCKNPAENAYDFQTFVFATRIIAIHKAFKENPHADVYILERSPFTDIIFWELQKKIVDPMQIAMYAMWSTAWLSFGQPFDPATAKVLYLKTTLTESQKRVAARSRDGEKSSVTIEYQMELRRVHEALLEGLHEGEFPDMPAYPYGEVIVLGADIADGNFKDEGAEQHQILQNIVMLLGMSCA